MSGQTFTGNATVVGWGATEEGGQINGILQSAEVRFTNYDGQSNWNQFTSKRWLLWIRRGAKLFMGRPFTRLSRKIIYRFIDFFKKI